jgi:hypothetical protein
LQACGVKKRHFMTSAIVAFTAAAVVPLKAGGGLIMFL